MQHRQKSVIPRRLLQKLFRDMGGVLRFYRSARHIAKRGEDFHTAWKKGVQAGSKGTGLTEAGPAPFERLRGRVWSQRCRGRAFALPPVYGTFQRPVGECAIRKDSKRKAIPDAGVLLGDCRCPIFMLNSGLSNIALYTTRVLGRNRKWMWI